MNVRFFVAGAAVAALAVLSGCAGGVNASRPIEYANTNKAIADEAGVCGDHYESAKAKKEDERVENELRGDVERKLIYQSILDQEVKNGRAK